MEDDKPAENPPAERKPSEGKPTLPAGAFAGRDTFRDLVRTALAAAQGQGWKEIILCDADFADWPLGERAVAESLAAWSQAGRKCVLMARTWDEAQRRHARFVTWRRTWSHIIEARSCRSADPEEFPSAIWTPGWVLERRDVIQSRGWMGPEADRRVALREKINEWMGKSSPGFASHTTGL
jgi:hypothetical protein